MSRLENGLKVTVLTQSAINSFFPDTLKVTGSTISTPKSYDEHSRQVKYGSPPPPPRAQHQDYPTLFKKYIGYFKSHNRMSLLRDYTNSLTSLSADFNWQKVVTQRSTLNLVGVKPQGPHLRIGMGWRSGGFFGSEILALRDFLGLQFTPRFFRDSQYRPGFFAYVFWGSA